MERAAGIEPAWPAWKAGTLPLSYARAQQKYTRSSGTEQADFQKKPRFSLPKSDKNALKERQPLPSSRRAGSANAGVVQWQNVSFPSLKRGFDSRHP
jgi:hypothetical protein